MQPGFWLWLAFVSKATDRTGVARGSPFAPSRPCAVSQNNLEKAAARSTDNAGCRAGRLRGGSDGLPFALREVAAKADRRRDELPFLRLTIDS